MTDELIRELRTAANRGIEAMNDKPVRSWSVSIDPYTVIALLDEIESLRKDAERYRFIRKPAMSQRESRLIAEAIDSSCEEELDAAIDAAMEDGK